MFHRSLKVYLTCSDPQQYGPALTYNGETSTSNVYVSMYICKLDQNWKAFTNFSQYCTYLLNISQST